MEILEKTAMKIRICFFASLILLIVLSQAVLAGDTGGTDSDHALDYKNPDNWVYYQVDADRETDVFLICPIVDKDLEAGENWW